MTRRDLRRLGPGPYVRGLRWLVNPATRAGFPFSVPALAAVDRLDLDAPITLLAGENGSGKSTVVETLAAAMGFAPQGGELDRLGELPAVPRPVLWPPGPRGEPILEPVLSDAKPREGYFLRAESFFNIAQFVDSGDRFAPDLSLYGDVPLHEQSHGQSFLALAAGRFGGESLYLLDEPEAALSVSGALALLAVVVRAARAGAQFVIATHSPVVLACPGARIYELDEEGLAPCGYDALDAVRLTRGFLDDPDRYLRAALGDGAA
jgi:predicted ATPase